MSAALVLFDLHFVFDVISWILQNLVIFRSMNPFRIKIDLHVLDELGEVPVLVAKLVDGLPVKYLS